MTNPLPPVSAYEPLVPRKSRKEMTAREIRRVVELVRQGVEFELIGERMNRATSSLHQLYNKLPPQLR